MEREELEAFREAVDRKSEEARRRSEATGQPKGMPADEDGPDMQRSLTDDNRPQDVGDPHAKSSRHGHVTAENWNQ